MYAIANTTPYRAKAALLRDRHGAETLVTVVKGTFRVLATGVCDVDEEQFEIVELPLHSGEPGRSSLLSDSDFVPVKVTTDVLVSAAAYPGTHAGEQPVLVHMQVGPMTKRLRVWGDRYWVRSGADWITSRPLPFERMPIEYERAEGGNLGPPGPDGIFSCDPRNPLGRGFGAEAHRNEGDPLPNIEYEDSRAEPAGFGPIARHWSPRVELAGTYDTDWRAQRFPLLPHDFDDRFYNCAPVDQQSPRHLTGGEPVLLENLSPGGVLQFTLPKVYMAFNAQIGAAVEAHRPVLHTVLLKPDERRVVMTWVGAVRCQGRSVKIRRIHIREKPRVVLRTPDIEVTA